MHQPSLTPRESVFFRYDVHPFRRPPELDGRPMHHRVVVVGAGPVGLLTALELAHFGVPSVIVESEAQISHGSRAIVLTRKSVEILQQAGLVQPFIEKGLPWQYGRSFYRGREVYRMVMPHDADDRFLPGLNIQQQYIEQFLVEAIAVSPLIELRWQTACTGLRQDDDHVTVHLDTPAGAYELHADWCVAADGGRSTVRRVMGLRLEGAAYRGNFVIADILAPIDLPTERLCYFDPAWNPGNNVLVHRQPDSVWRLDFRLPDDETAEQALEPHLLGRRIEAILKMIGQPVQWQLDWATVYSASTKTLADYRVGRVLFAGDAAHLLPIFGVRGANTGFQDADNLGWKLAALVNGWGDASLLDSYSTERVTAAREICAEGGRSTRFMTPPTAGYRLMRDATLSFSLSQDFAKDFMHWRTSRPHVYARSLLNALDDDNAMLAGGFANGEPARNVRLDEGDYLFDHLRSGFHILLFPAGARVDAAEREVLALGGRRTGAPVDTVLIGATHQAGSMCLADPAGRAARKYAATGGAVYLLRPDLHICGRWQRADAQRVAGAIRRALAPGPARSEGEEVRR
jgi:3-(3-hydroxy-phenyl)propionate hydroxylase